MCVSFLIWCGYGDCNCIGLGLYIYLCFVKVWFEKCLVCVSCKIVFVFLDFIVLVNLVKLGMFLFFEMLKLYLNNWLYFVIYVVLVICNGVDLVWWIVYVMLLLVIKFFDVEELVIIGDRIKWFFKFNLLGSINGWNKLFWILFIFVYCFFISYRFSLKFIKFCN